MYISIALKILKEDAAKHSETISRQIVEGEEIEGGVEQISELIDLLKSLDNESDLIKKAIKKLQSWKEENWILTTIDPNQLYSWQNHWSKKAGSVTLVLDYIHNCIQEDETISFDGIETDFQNMIAVLEKMLEAEDVSKEAKEKVKYLLPLGIEVAGYAKQQEIDKIPFQKLKELRNFFVQLNKEKTAKMIADRYRIDLQAHMLRKETLERLNM